MIPHGHVPAYLRDMFCAALEYGAAHESWWEWFGSENADRFLWRKRDGGRWSRLDAKARAAWVTGQLVHGTEMMPERILTLLDLEPEQTYAEIARRLRPQVAEGEASGKDAENGTEPPVALRIGIPRDLMDRLTTMSGKMGLSLDDAVRHAIAEWLS
jgi:hypothetical protein